MGNKEKQSHSQEVKSRAFLFLRPLLSLSSTHSCDVCDQSYVSPNFHLSLMGAPLAPPFRLLPTTVGTSCLPIHRLTMIDRLLFAKYKGSPHLVPDLRCLYLSRAGGHKRHGYHLMSVMKKRSNRHCWATRKRYVTHLAELGTSAKKAS